MALASAVGIIQLC